MELYQLFRGGDSIKRCLSKGADFVVFYAQEV